MFVKDFSSCVYGNVIVDGQANTSNLMCVSKARLGNYICTLSAADMKAIEKALAKTIDLMKHYANIKSKYDNKVQYIATVKKERNAAQDELADIRAELGINANDSIIESIKLLNIDMHTKKSMHGKPCNH